MGAQRSLLHVQARVQPLQGKVEGKSCGVIGIVSTLYVCSITAGTVGRVSVHHVLGRGWPWHTLVLKSPPGYVISVTRRWRRGE